MDEAVEPLISDKDHHFVPGDLVWGKLKNHQWWPGLVLDPSSDSTIKETDKKIKESSLLVEFLGSTMASTWCEGSELRPFVSDYKIVLLASRSSRRGSGFSGAMEKALEELRRRVEVQMMCKCVPEEARPQLDGPEELRTYGLSIVDGLGTDDFLQRYYNAACDASSVDLLDAVVMQGWMTSFFRSSGRYAPLPFYHMFDGIENVGEVKVKAKKERSMAELIAETDFDAVEYEDEALVEVVVVENVKKSAGRKRKKKREEEEEEEEEEEISVEQLEDVVSDDGGDDGCDDAGKEEQHESGRRERKKSKYLSPPYTMMNVSNKNSVFPKLSGSLNNEEGSNTDDELLQSRPVVKSSKKGFAFDEYNGASSDELLSEFRLVALDTMYLVDHQYDNIIRGFFDRFRNSVFISGSYFEEYNSKCSDSSDGGDVIKSQSSGEMFSLEGKPGGFQIVNGVSESKTSKQTKSPVSKANGIDDDNLRSRGFDINISAESQENSYNNGVSGLVKGDDAVEGASTEGRKRKSVSNNVNGSLEVKRRGRPRKKPINIEPTQAKEAKSADSANKIFSNEKIDEVSSDGIASTQLETSNIDPSNPPFLSQTIQKPPLDLVKKSLEDLIISLNDSATRGEDATSPSELKPEVRENLVDEMSGLLTKVNKMLNNIASSADDANADGNTQ